MTPGSFPLEIYRGDSYRWQFKLWNDTGKTDPVDLTGVTAKAEIRDRPGGKKVTPMACTIDAPNIVNVALSAANSALLVGGKASWDLQLTYSGGDVSTVLAGPVTVTVDVTDSVA
jgi:hypothetical protein